MAKEQEPLADPVWASLSARGGRRANQDRLGHAVTAAGHAFVVADGLGGHAAGEVAAEAAVDAILESLRGAGAPSAEGLVAAFAAAQRAVGEAERSAPGRTGCRTTAVVLWLGGGQALWAHVGDSRLYHLRGGRVLHQTRDHSVPQALVDAGEIETSAIRGHPDRNRLLRAIGGADDLAPSVQDAPVALEPGDAFLLCTDGFWELVTETEMTGALGEGADPEGWLARLERRLEARATGEYDNYTALAVVLGSPRPVRRRRVPAGLGALAFALALALGSALSVERCLNPAPRPLLLGSRGPQLGPGRAAPGFPSAPLHSIAALPRHPGLQ
jgi:PPM family protein phosphatase